MDQQKKAFMRVGTRECGIVCGLIGALIALSLIFLGFWKTLLIVALFAVGYVLGAYSNKKEVIKKTVNTITSQKNN
ncbi:MAG: DUF2273 domain-containing protein [Clostridiales bacterium]|nr:DUF2273 domain-containing protein [Clostridiales bacterium]